MLGIGPRSIVSRPPLWLLLSGSASPAVLNCAQTLLDGETQGLAFDFTDSSAYIIDTGTPANNYDSTGIVSSGSLVGPSGKLTYTSPSNKLTLQSDGYIKYQAHNLCLRSTLAGSVAGTPGTAPTGWTNPSAGGTIDSVTLDSDGDYSISLSATANRQYLSQDVTVVVGATYRLSAIVTMDGVARLDKCFNIATASVSGTWYFNGSATAGSATPSGTGTLEFIFTVSSGTTAAVRFGIGTYASDTGTFIASKINLARYPANTDYIKTTSAAKYALPLEYDTSGNCEGLLVELAQTNLALHSNTLNNATGGYTETGVSSSASSGSIFDGLSRHTLTASGSGAHALWRSVTLSAATTYTLSAILEPDAGVSAGIMIYDSTGGVGVIHKWNLSTEASLTAETLGAGLTVAGTGITDLGGGKRRVWSTVTTSANTTYNIYIYVLQADGTRSYTASGEAIIGHHFQLEAGSFPTSPILTYGAAATRAADPLSQLTSTFPLSATAGSLYAYVAPYAGADLAGIVSLNDGSGDEEIAIYKDASANIVAQVEDGGVGQLAPLDSTVNASSGTAFKVALAWAENDFALSADGTVAQTDTGGTLPTVTTLEIGVDQANNYFNGHIKAISYVPRRKSNAELQAETT